MGGILTEAAEADEVELTRDGEDVGDAPTPAVRRELLCVGAV